MKNTKALSDFITEDQILEVLIKYETSKMEACDMLKSYLFDKWQVTTIQAVGILKNVYEEFTNR